MTETQKDYMMIQEVKWQEKMVTCPCKNNIEDDGVYCTASTTYCSFKNCLMRHWGLV